jgi:hypothetical protein
MADYSTEFDEGLGDFSIQEELNTLHPNEYVLCMCEGFGFTHIGKDINGVEQIGFTNFNEPESEVKWIPFAELTAYTYKEIFA